MTSPLRLDMLLLDAAGKGHVEEVRSLLKIDTNPNYEDDSLRTPLSYAAERGHLPVVAILLEQGAEVDCKPRQDGLIVPDSAATRYQRKRTPLSYAAERGHEDVAMLLLKNGADGNSENERKRTPLSYAAERGHVMMVKLLVENNKANVNSNDEEGSTPLSYAAHGGHEAVVFILLYYGAYRGSLALHWRNQHDGIYKLLRQEYQTSRDSVPNFTYMPLLSQYSFRLVKLSCSLTGPLECTLEPYHLSDDQCPSYTALSYAWGGTERNARILLNGFPFLVTENLFNALTKLRIIGYSRLLWIDLICIDQMNLAERSHQVSIMRSIFSAADTVLAWLDIITAVEASDTTGYGLLGSNSGLTLRKEETASEETTPSFSDFDIVSKIATQSYWSRVWIIQELMVARKISFLFRQGALTWDSFVSAVKHICNADGREKNDQSVRWELLEAMSVSNCRQVLELWEKRGMESLNLSTLVRFSMNSLASDPRDKIYALLGIASHGYAAGIDPDYNLSACSVYSTAVTSILVDGEDVFCLGTYLHTHLARLKHDPFSKDDSRRHCDGIQCGIWDFCKLVAVRAAARQQKPTSVLLPCAK